MFGQDVGVSSEALGPRSLDPKSPAPNPETP